MNCMMILINKPTDATLSSLDNYQNPRWHPRWLNGGTHDGFQDGIPGCVHRTIATHARAPQSLATVGGNALADALYKHVVEQHFALTMHGHCVVFRSKCCIAGSTRGSDLLMWQRMTARIVRGSSGKVGPHSARSVNTCEASTVV